MALLDNETSKQMQDARDLVIAAALANDKVFEAINTLIEEGIEPSIAHGCMMHLRRKISQSS